MYTIGPITMVPRNTVKNHPLFSVEADLLGCSHATRCLMLNITPYNKKAFTKNLVGLGFLWPVFYRT